MSVISMTVKKDIRGNTISPRSSYTPSQAEKEKLAIILQQFSDATQIQTRPFREFNDMSLIDRMARDQKSFNGWQEGFDGDPDTAWKSRAVRPIVRNKIISIAAHVTATLLFPKVFAQNERDEEDREASEVLRDLIEWWGENSDYARKFVYAVISALVNPAAIIHTEFSQCYRKIKESNIDGSYTVKEVLDEVFSGFNNNLVPVDEFFIENIYEHDIQKQGYVIWRKYITHSAAKSKYSKYERFNSFVKPGIQTFFDTGSDTFYEEYDDSLNGNLVEEVLYWNRSEDEYLIVVNGVLITKHDNPNPRADKMYPFLKMGYELIDEGKFFYFRSLANKTSVDEEVVNTLYRMVIDGTYLQLMPPIAIFGDEEVDSSVIMPGVVTSFSGETKMQELKTGTDLGAGVKVLEKVEASISESSIDALQSGQSAQGTPSTAYEISRLEQNSKTMLGLFGKMIGFAVEDWGKLAISDVLQFSTVEGVTDLLTDSASVKFRKLLLPEKVSKDGKKRTKVIQFNNELEENPDEEYYKEASFKIMEEEVKNGDEKEILMVNHCLLKKLKYKVKVDADLVTPASDSLRKAMSLEAYDRAIANPNANQEMIYRDLLLGAYDQTKDYPDKYIIKKEASPLSAVMGVGTPTM